MRSLAVSVIIPAYNRGTIVRRAIDSALAAIRPGDEVLVVDDGSTDDTPARLASYRDRIRYLSFAHVGPGAIRNLGVRAASNPLVAFLDSDDEWMPDKLELQRTVMEKRPEVLFCFSDFGHRTRDGREFRRFLHTWHRDPRNWDEILPTACLFSSLGPLPPGRQDFRIHLGDLYPTEMLGDYVCTSTVVVRREEAGSALHFAENLWRYEDWACFGQLARAGVAAYLDCETQWNCDHEGPRLTHADRIDGCTARLAVLTKVWGSDRAFLAEHAGPYGAVLTSHRRAKARALIAAGRTKEAREELRLAGSASISERLLASLPGVLARGTVAVRNRLRGQRGGVSSKARTAQLPRILRSGQRRSDITRRRADRFRVGRHKAFVVGSGRLFAFGGAEIMAARTNQLHQVERLPRAFSIRPVTAGDDRFLGTLLTPHKAARLMSSGDTGLVAVAQGSIHAMTWVRFGPAEYTDDRRPLGVVLQIPPGYCWLHNGRATDAEVPGPWAMIMGRLPGLLRERGIDAVCLQVASHNMYSIKCHESFGFRKVGHVAAIRVAGLTLCLLRVGAQKRLVFGETRLVLDQLPI